MSFPAAAGRSPPSSLLSSQTLTPPFPLSTSVPPIPGQCRRRSSISIPGQCRRGGIVGVLPGSRPPARRSRVSAVASSGEPRPSDGGGSVAPAAPRFLEFITSERVKVAAMVALALALCNVDRVVMSVAIVPLSETYGWSRSFSGVVQSSFLWGYLSSPIVGGMLVDVFGGKLVMACGVALWSAATYLTPWAAENSLWALLSVRALLGVAEGVALPSMNNMIVRWFPRVERARAVGIAMAGFTLGNAIGLVLSPIIMSQVGVLGPFVIFGLSGFLWVLVWISATSSSPQRHPQISKDELDYIMNEKIQSSPQPGSENVKAKVVPPFGILLSKPPVWAVISANAMHSWGFFVILSWMPIFFKSVYHVDLRQAAWFSAIPWAVMAALGYVGGLCSDLLIQSGLTVTLTRKIMQSIGFMGPGIALLGLSTAKNPSVASIWLTIAVGLKSFSHSGFLVNFQEIAPEYSGVIHGMANTAGTLAAIVGTVGAGYFAEIMGSFRGFLMLTAVLYFVSALIWNTLASGERINFNATS